MNENLDTSKLRLLRQEKLKGLQAQQKNLKQLQTELEKINAKINNNEKLSEEDTKFIGQLGWLSGLSVTIASIAASLTGLPGCGRQQYRAVNPSSTVGCGSTALRFTA
jgi:hypothetical protein